jgi:hypothetical protein
MSTVLLTIPPQMGNVEKDRGGIQYHGRNELGPSKQKAMPQCCELARLPIAKYALHYISFSSNSTGLTS